jgi:hypothetical protein
MCRWNTPTPTMELYTLLYFTGSSFLSSLILEHKYQSKKLLYVYSTFYVEWVLLKLYMWTFISYIKTRICLPMGLCEIRVAQFVAFCIVFCGIMSFSIGNFIFYPLIYCFWLPLWHLKIVRIVDKMMMISMLY